MSKNGAYLVKPLRIALLCASALMLSTAFAEDGSNLSDIQYHPGSDSGRVVNSSTDRWVTPADLDGDGSQLHELQYHSGIDGGRVVNSRADRHIVPADLDGDGSEVYEIQYHPPVKPQPYVYNIDNAAYFGFNMAVLSDQAKADLDRMVARMDQADSIRSVTITGHADTIGTTPYNRVLAFRRADAVKSYLVSKGIASDRITTESEGSASPLVSCNADKTRTDKINCLAPDRRADVDALLASHSKTGNANSSIFHS